MANTRDITLPAIWADDAITTIPAEPTPGLPYRREALTDLAVTTGHPFNSAFDTPNVNQYLWIMSSLVDAVEKQGILGWSSLTNYDTLGAIVRGSNGTLYRLIAVNGPDDPAGVQDPISTSGFWSFLDSSIAGNTSGIYRFATTDSAGGINTNISPATGWTLVHDGFGNYTITHNLNTLNYLVTGITLLNNVGTFTISNKTINTFEVNIDSPRIFQLIVAS